MEPEQGVLDAELLRAPTEEVDGDGGDGEFELEGAFREGDAAARHAAIAAFTDTARADGPRVLLLSSKHNASGTNLQVRPVHRPQQLYLL